MPTLSSLFATPTPTNAAVPISNGTGAAGASLDDWVSNGSGGIPGGSSGQLQFNFAGVFGGISGATSDGTTLSVTSPKVITGINDTNSNELLKMTPTGSAVNELTLANAATGNNPVLSATGDDTNIGMIFFAKGTGKTQFASSSGIVGAEFLASPGSQAFFNFKDGSDYKWQFGKQTDNTFVLYDNVAAQFPLRVATGGVVKLIESGGRLIVGTTSDDGVNMLQVNGPIKTDGGVQTFGIANSGGLGFRMVVVPN